VTLFSASQRRHSTLLIEFEKASFFTQARSSQSNTVVASRLQAPQDGFCQTDPCLFPLSSAAEIHSEVKVEPHGQEPVAPAVRRNPPKLQSSFAKASEDTRIPSRSGDRGFLRRRVKSHLGEYSSCHFLFIWDNMW